MDVSQDKTYLAKSQSLIRLIMALGLASLACLALLALRMYGLSESSLYRWIVIPNLILAWIPLVIALLVKIWWERQRRLNFPMLLLLALWLLFLPNAPYIVTDLVHLTYLKSTVPIHFDILLNFFTAVTALIIGYLSLYVVQDMIQAQFNKWTSWLLMIILLFLCSIGVFLGRFLRWNSWDFFKKPLAIITDSIALFEKQESLLFIGTCMIFISLSYYIFYCSIRLKA